MAITDRRDGVAGGITAADRRSGIHEGIQLKRAVRGATTANITLSGTQTIDGLSVVADDRVLVKNQTTASQNGIYVASAGSWVRATDFDGNTEVEYGTLVFVAAGTANAATIWYVTTTDDIVFGTTSINFALVLAPSQAADIVNADVDANAAITSDKLSFLQAGTGAVARSVRAKLREVVSVADFGATGDGSTDDTTAIQNAIDSLGTNGGVVFFPRTSAHTYIISPITIGDGTWSGATATAVATKQNIVLMGEVGHGGTTELDSGAKSIKLKYKSTASLAGVAVTFSGPGSFGMENLEIDCNAGRAGYALNLKGVYRSSFRNLTLRDFSTTGMIHAPTPTLPSGLFISASDNIFDNIEIYSIAYGATCGADIGLQDASTGSFDVSRDTFRNLVIEITDSLSASAVNLRGADLLTFINPFWSSPGNRRAKSLYVLPPTSSTYLPSNITFINAALVGVIFTPTDGTWTPNGSGSNYLAEGLFFAPLACGDMMAPGFSGRSGIPTNATYGGINGFTSDGRRIGSEPNAQTGTSYAFKSSDNGRLVTFSNTAATAVTLSQADAYTGFGPNWDCLVNNLNYGVVTITPATSTINGVATLVLRRGQGAHIRSDGTNYTAAVFEVRTALFTATADGSALANSNTLTTLKTSAQSIPANALILGSIIRVRASGLYTASNAGAVNRTITINLAVGGTSVCYVSQALSISETAVDWHFDTEVMIRTAGGSGSMLSGLTTGAVWPYAGCAGISQGAQTIDTTAAKAVAVQAQWSATDATTSITCKSMTVEIINPGSTG